MTELRTERLVLRRLTLAEARAVVALDRAGRRWAQDYPTEGDLVVAGIAVEAAEHHDDTGAFGVYQVLLVDTDEVVGGIGFIHPPEAGVVEVGYGLAESVRGRGLATEALRAMLALAAASSVQQMVAMTDPENRSSQRVLERCGFTACEELVTGDEGPMIRWEKRIDSDARREPTHLLAT